LHLANNSPLNLIDGSISGFTSSEKHHIFPNAFLRNNRHDGSIVHALPNFCFLPSELNKQISDTRPSEYFADLSPRNSSFADAALSHLIPMGPDNGVDQDDYLAFLQARANMILGEIARLCGSITTPREDERQKTVEKLEIRIRDIIHANLLEAHGDGYWKATVPEAIRREAEKRIDSDLRTNPDRSADEFSGPRAKLNFCNVMDYVPIVTNKGNWPAFEDVLRKKEDFQQQMKAFSDYRNAVMHVRDMTEFVRLGGERAMIWIESVLSIDSDDGTDDPSGEDPIDV
jgi:hypothetical protein